jgi:glycosyltransferase involved in cell wall biosynthesis
MCTVVIPCLNEQASLANIVKNLEETFHTSGFDITALFVDDGSTDDTWKLIKSLHFATRNISVSGVRLGGNKGKAFAQAVGLRESLGRGRADFVAFMDADGQHDASALLGMLHASIETSLPCVGRRHGYQRSSSGALGVMALRFISFIVGVEYHPLDSEFLVIPRQRYVQMSGNPQLGVIPLLPLLYQTGSVTRIDVTIRSSIEDHRVSRWGLRGLWQKGILQVLSNPWVSLPRLAAVFATVVFLIGSYGVIVGIQSVLSGSFVGIGSVILIQSITFSFLTFLLLGLLGMMVILTQATLIGRSSTTVEEHCFRH